MFIQSRAAVRWVATALGVCVLAACSSSGSKSPSGNPTTQGSQQSSTTPATNALSKTEFVAQANALCKSTLGKIDALPTPSGPDDYAAIIATVDATLALFPPWLAQEKALVAQSSDKGELTKNWLALDESDFNAQKPLVAKLRQAAAAKHADETAEFAGQLDAAPSHSDSIASYLTSYGLTECAQLETQ